MSELFKCPHDCSLLPLKCIFNPSEAPPANQKLRCSFCRSCCRDSLHPPHQHLVPRQIKVSLTSVPVPAAEVRQLDPVLRRASPRCACSGGRVLRRLLKQTRLALKRRGAPIQTANRATGVSSFYQIRGKGGF